VVGRHYRRSHAKRKDNNYVRGSSMQSNNLFTRLLCAGIAAILAAALAAMPVFAADDDEEESEDMEEITVMATRRETNVMETPFAMQVFGGDRLEEENIRDTRDLWDHMPGITLQEDNGVSDQTVQMRGSGITSVSADDGQSAIGSYIDDVPWLNINSQVAAPIDYFDVQRVEVLRGPQGTSYGQDATGGSIRVYTRDPDLTQFSAKVRAGVTHRKGMDGKGRNLNAVANLPIIEDVLGVRVSLADRYDQGYGVVEGRPDWKNPNEYDTRSYRIKGLWIPTENVEAALSYSHWKYEQDLFRVWHQISSDTGKSILRPLLNRFSLAYYPSGKPENGSETDFVSFTAKVDLGWAEFQSTTGYMDNIGFFNGDSAGAGVGLRYDVITENVTQELRLVSKGDSPLQWLAGFYYHDAQSDVIGIYDVDYGQWYNYTAASIGFRASEARSVYGEVSYQINDQWVVLAGLRYYEDDRALRDTLTFREADASYGPIPVGTSDPSRPDDPLVGHTRDPSLNSFTGPSEFDGRKFSFDNWNPRINVTYYPRDGAMVYMNAATGFRAPIFHRIQQKLDLEFAGFTNFATYDGTEVTSVEVGTKWALFDGRLDLEGAIAFADWKYVPIGVSFEIDRDGPGGADPITTSAPIPGGDARIETYEITANWRINDAFGVRYTGAYVSGEITRDESDTVGGFPENLKKGNPVPNTSPKSHGVGLNYSAPLMNTGWRLFGSANWAYRSKEFKPNAAANNYKVVSGTLGISKGPWTVDLSGQNLTNYDKAWSNASSTYNNGTISIPRTIMLQVTWDGAEM